MADTKTTTLSEYLERRRKEQPFRPVWLRRQQQAKDLTPGPKEAA